MFSLGDDLIQRIRLENILHSQNVDEEPGQTNKKWQETDLFPAVRTSDVQQIIVCVEKQDININAVDIFGRNALQSALDRGRLTEEACQVLIELGINLDHPDNENHTALAKVVFYYKDTSKSEENNSRDLKLFRLMAENGANLHGTFELGIKKVDIREKIRSHPEMEAIVQMLPALYVQRARKVYKALKGDPRVTQLVFQMIGFDPERFWEEPPVCADPKARKYGAPIPCTRITPPL
jgi:hypothetical protein